MSGGPYLHARKIEKRERERERERSGPSWLGCRPPGVASPLCKKKREREREIQRDRERERERERQPDSESKRGLCFLARQSGGPERPGVPLWGALFAG